MSLRIFAIFYCLILFTSCSLINSNAGAVAINFRLNHAEHKIKDTSVYESKFKDSDFSEENLKKYSGEEIDYILDTLSFFSSDRALSWREKVLAEKAFRESKSSNPRPLEWYAENIQRDYLRKGKLEKAFELQAKYPELSLSKLPERMITEKSAGNAGWRVYDISEDGDTVILKDSQLAKGKHIVMYVSWGCEFADMAIEAIMTSPELKKVFTEKGTVLGSYLNIKEQLEWKDATGMERVYSKYSTNEIKPLASLDSPTFFFMSGGKVKYEFDGVFPNEESMGLLKRFREGLAAMKEEPDDEPAIKSTENPKPSPVKRAKRQSPFIVNYSNAFNLARDYQLLEFINNVVISLGCVYANSIAGISQISTIKALGRNLNDISFCPGKAGKPDKSNTFHLFSLLKGVSPAHKIEFARSIITKDGHIISAYIGGIEKDLGKAKAKEIAIKLAGQEPQFDTVCEIAENQDTGAKTISPVSEKSYFCLVE